MTEENTNPISSIGVCVSNGYCGSSGNSCYGATLDIVDILLEHYRNHHFKDLDQYLSRFQKSTVDDCVYGEFGYGPNGKHCRHPHQRRLDEQALNNFSQSISGAKITANSYQTFEDLYDALSKVPHKGIGPVTLYDTALRLGRLCNPIIEPKQFVYVHAGAMEGAIGLVLNLRLWTQVTKRPSSRQFYTIDMLRPALKVSHRIDIKWFKDVIKQFPTMDAKHLENFLCIYDRYLQLPYGPRIGLAIQNIALGVANPYRVP